VYPATLEVGQVKKVGKTPFQNGNNPNPSQRGNKTLLKFTLERFMDKNLGLLTSLSTFPLGHPKTPLGVNY